MFFNAPLLIQSDEMEGGALSDDDFQDESLLTHRKPAATIKRVHHVVTKVCVATGVCQNTELTLKKYFLFQTGVNNMLKHSMGKILKKNCIFFFIDFQRHVLISLEVENVSIPC